MVLVVPVPARNKSSVVLVKDSTVKIELPFSWREIWKDSLSENSKKLFYKGHLVPMPYAFYSPDIFSKIQPSPGHQDNSSCMTLEITWEVCGIPSVRLVNSFPSFG